MGVIRAAVLALSLAGPADAQEAPPVFIAETRAPMHAAPDGDVVGALPAGAKPIEASAVEDGWVRTILREGDVWIPLDALAPLEPRMIGGGLLPDGLSCLGAEPSWTIAFDGGTASVRRPGVRPEALRTLGGERARGRRFPVRIRLARENGEAGDLLVEPRLCSDTMSDRTYPWTATLVLRDGPLLTGCCRLPRAQ